MKTIAGAITFGNGVKRLEQVFRNAFRFGIGGAAAGSWVWTFPGVLLYWRKLGGRLNNPMEVARPIHQTALSVSHQVNVNIVNTQSTVALKNSLFVDQRGPFQCRTIVQNLLYPTTLEPALSLPEPAALPIYRELPMRPSGETTDAPQAVTLRWRRLAAMSQATDATPVFRQRIKSDSIAAIAFELSRPMRGNERSAHVPTTVEQGAPEGLMQPVIVRRSNFRHLSLLTIRPLEDNKSIVVQSLRFLAKGRMPEPSVSEDNIVSPLVTAPIQLVWRQPEPSRDSLSQAGALEPEQCLGDSVNPVSSASQAIHATPPVTEKSTLQTTEAKINELLSGSTLDRLADDVMRRIDKRLRIERERRGL